MIKQIALITSFIIIGYLIDVSVKYDTELKQTQEKLIQSQIQVIDLERQLEIVKKDLLNDTEFALEVAAMYTNIDKDIIKAQAKLETGNFTSRRYKENYNLFGIGVYNDKEEGFIYYNELHCCLHYARIINDNYDLYGADINTFTEGISKWAEDKEYGNKIKRVYEEEK